MGLQKNVASQKWRVFAFDITDGSAQTADAANITAKIAKDWAAAAATNDLNPTEVEDGYYVFDLTQAETNADVLDLYPESSTANIQVVGVPGTIFTTPPNFSALGIASDGDISGNVDGNVIGSVASVTADVGVNEWNGVSLGTTNPLPNAAAGAAGGLPTDSTGKTAFNDLSEVQVKAQCDAAIVTYHLDHLLATDYDPASKPGVATALLNELVENDGGVSRYTANALEQAPTPPTATAIVDEWETQSQADPTSFHVNVKEVNGTAQTANDNGADINTLITQVGTAGAGLTDLGGMSTGMIAEVTAAALTTQMTEAYAADGVAPTLAQAIFAIQQFLQEKAVNSTTMTVKKLDGSTTAMTFTLDDDTAPTSITRAT